VNQQTSLLTSGTQLVGKVLVYYTFLEMERWRERGKTAKAEFGLITIRLDHGNMAIMLSDADETTEANGKFGMALARAITNSRRSRWL
jgi:hypothetical protein